MKQVKIGRPKSRKGHSDYEKLRIQGKLTSAISGMVVVESLIEKNEGKGVNQIVKVRTIIKKIEDMLKRYS